jgi:hypothetical protein
MRARSREHISDQIWVILWIAKYRLTRVLAAAHIERLTLLALAV